MKKSKVIALILVGALSITTGLGLNVEASENKVNNIAINSATAKDNYFLMPNSSSVYLTWGDLEGYNLDELAIIRNEIYARHGYNFKQKKFRDYFNNQEWYKPSEHNVTTKDLSKLEYENVILIKEMEESYSSDNSNYNYDFIIPDSNVRKITSKELKYLNTQELAIARNEIYARHGYIFVSDEWKNFFIYEEWYTPKAYSVTLNSVEEYNVAMILKEEARR